MNKTANGVWRESNKPVRSSSGIRRLRSVQEHTTTRRQPKGACWDLGVTAPLTSAKTLHTASDSPLLGAWPLTDRGPSTLSYLVSIGAALGCRKELSIGITESIAALQRTCGHLHAWVCDQQRRRNSAILSMFFYQPLALFLFRHPRTTIPTTAHITVEHPYQRCLHQHPTNSLYRTRTKGRPQQFSYVSSRQHVPPETHSHIHRHVRKKNCTFVAFQLGLLLYYSNTF
jgi:hypothetical protein